jgi:hypothetical protein
MEVALRAYLIKPTVWAHNSVIIMRVASVYWPSLAVSLRPLKPFSVVSVFNFKVGFTLLLYIVTRLPGPRAASQKALSSMELR